MNTHACIELILFIDNNLPLKPIQRNTQINLKFMVNEF